MRSTATFDVGVTRVSRRGVLIGIGAALAAPMALAVSGPAAADNGIAPDEVECLADLIQGGFITRSDLLVS